MSLTFRHEEITKSYHRNRSSSIYGHWPARLPRDEQHANRSTRNGVPFQPDAGSPLRAHK